MVVHILIEEHPRIDRTDMQALVEIACEEGLEADITAQETALKAAWWALTLHWMADDTSHLAFDSLVTAVAIKAHKYFTKKGKEPPRRLDIKDREGRVIGSIEVPHSGEDDVQS